MPDPDLVLVRRDDLAAVYRIALMSSIVCWPDLSVAERVEAAVNGEATAVEHGEDGDAHPPVPTPTSQRPYATHFRHVGPWAPVDAAVDALARVGQEVEPAGYGGAFDSDEELDAFQAWHRDGTPTDADAKPNTPSVACQTDEPSGVEKTQRCPQCEALSRKLHDATAKRIAAENLATERMRERDEARWDTSVLQTEADIAYEQACEQLKRDNQELQAVVARYRAALERIAVHDSDDPFAEAAIARAALGTDAHDNPIYGSVTDQTP